MEEKVNRAGQGRMGKEIKFCTFLHDRYIYFSHGQHFHLSQLPVNIVLLLGRYDLAVCCHKKSVPHMFSLSSSTYPHMYTKD